MGNQISDDARGATLKMSNGATSVLLSVLLLAGASLAETDWQRDLVMWLTSHDQSVVGGGTVGFDRREIAWTKDGFAEQKQFLLKMIDAALNKHRWDALSYDPPLVADNLTTLKSMVEEFQFPATGCPAEFPPLLKPAELTKCTTHQIYLHEVGCYICLDSSYVETGVRD